MKVVAAIFLFICAAEASPNWIGLPETDLKELDNLLEDTKSVADPTTFGDTATLGNFISRAKYSAEQNDDRSEDGSGVNPTEEPKSPTKNLVEAIHLISPALKELREDRDKLNLDLANEFVEALKSEPGDNVIKVLHGSKQSFGASKNKPDDKVIRLFGEHVRVLHESCNNKKLEFVKEAHESGLFDDIKHDNVDFEDIVGEIVAKNGEGGDVFAGFVEAVRNHGLDDHPDLQVVKTIGGLFIDAACGLKLDGYLMAIGKLIKEEEGQQNLGKPEFLKNVNRIVYACKANFVRYYLGIIRDAIKLGGKIAWLKHNGDSRKNAMISTITSLHKQGKEEEADLILGKFVMGMMKRSTLVGILLPEYLKSGRPRGQKTGRKGDEPSPEAFVEDEYESTDTLQDTVK